MKTKNDSYTAKRFLAKA